MHLPSAHHARRAALPLAAAVLGAWVPLGGAAAEPTPTPAPTPVAAEAAGRATDDRGFVASSARCAPDQSAVALGVTRASLVAVCLVPSGGVDYRGVRLVDGAATALPATAVGAGFRAVADGGTTYDVTASALTVTVRGLPPRVEPMIAYRQPRLAAEAGPAPTSAPPTSAGPTTSATAPSEPTASPSGERGGAAEVGSPTGTRAPETFGPVTAMPTR